MIKQNNHQNKPKALLRDGRQLYHIQDLAVLWKIHNPNTLYTTIKRYVQSGTLNRIYKGFYSTVSLAQVDPVRLGLTALHSYGYLSTETVLAREGIIAQEIKYITLVSDISKRFELGGHKYLVRAMRTKYLHNTDGIVTKDGVREAAVSRAVSDLLYYNPDYHFDAEHLIDWDEVEKLRQQIGY